MPLPARLKADHFKPKPRLRSTAHRDWVRGHYCSVPGCQLMTISLCRDHHAESHRGEQTFSRKYGFNLLAKAEEFYRASPHRQKLDDPFR